MNNYQSEKQLILKYYSELDSAVGDDHYKIVNKYVAKNYLWRGFHPFNEKHSTQELVNDFWIPFKNAITRTQRRMDIFMAGDNSLEAGGVWVVSMGHLMGLFDHAWLGRWGGEQGRANVWRGDEKYVDGARSPCSDGLLLPRCAGYSVW